MAHGGRACACGYDELVCCVGWACVLFLAMYYFGMGVYMFVYDDGLEPGYG